MSSNKNRVKKVPKRKGESYLEAFDRQNNAYIAHGFEIGKSIAITQTLDVAIITLGEDFGFGPLRNRKFKEAFEKNWTEMLELSREDTEDKEYTKEILDRRLRAVISPDDYVPYSQRYEYDLDPKTKYK